MRAHVFLRCVSVDSEADYYLLKPSRMSRERSFQASISPLFLRVD